MSKRSQTGKTAGYALGRYVFTGAALGAYFGYFFQPQRAANWLMPVILGLLAALLTVGLQWLRKDNLQAGQRLQRFLMVWFAFSVVLLGLEARHWLYATGGRALTVAGSVVWGALAGWGMSRDPQRLLRMMGG